MAPVIPTHDYYAVLEALPNATYEEIKCSYRRLARLHHPDKNGGSPQATIKTQLINVAWEVLGDSCKRRQYDQSYRPPNNTSSASCPNASKPATTPQPSKSPPKASTSDQNAQDEARAQTENQKMRQEWLNWERLQEQSIRQCQKQVRAMEADIAALDEKIKANQAKLANDVPYWWNVLASKSTRLSELEKSDLHRQILDSEAAKRIKELPLNREQLRLQRLKDDLSKRRNEEEERLAGVQKERQRRERLAREKTEAEERQRRAEEYARQQAAREARERTAREEAARAEVLRQKKAAEMRAAREVIMKKAREDKEKRAKAEAEELERQQKHAQEERAKEQKKTKRRQARERLCGHKSWWDKVPGPLNCSHCTHPYGYAYQCPGCRTIACASCRGTLKAGRTPSIDNSWRNRQANTGASQRRPTPYSQANHYSSDYDQSNQYDDWSSY